VPPTRTVLTTSADETAALGAEAVRDLGPGDVVVLHGEVGAGKTTFVRGAARALGITRPVTSPTFTIGRRYEESAPPLAHVDLHRVGSLDEEEPELLADYLNSDHLAFVEWPEAAGDELTPRLRVRLEHAGGDRRRVELEWAA
jgi:tRNA threonylcarbamoyladenosine biosynthesis protein TsaE